MANADMIRLEPGEDAHFLGVSSGMHLARSVLESAQNADATLQPSERHATPFAATANASNEPLQQEVQSGFAALPAQDTAKHLVEIFLGQYEVQYPIVVGDELLYILRRCYSEAADESNDRRSHFILKMVFAIALIVLSRENPESLALSKMFSSSAMAEFCTIMQQKDVRTLQCLQFLLLWSILDSSSAPVWNISGLCMRMCVDLGFHSEATIRVSSYRITTVAGGGADIKRRLFWVTYNFDRTLSTLLGRPFTLCDDTIDVHLPGQSLPVAKRDQILHWLKLQQLQSQIVYRLYSLRSDGAKTTGGADSVDDADGEAARATTQWKKDMAVELQYWSRKAKTLADLSSHTVSNESESVNKGDHTLDWWEYWHQNAILLLHRPSPLKPQLDADEASICCTAAQSMIQLAFTRLQRGSADFAWVDLHYQLMSGITLLFLVCKHGPTRTKAKASWVSFKNCLMQWNYVLEQLARQWQRIQHARHVLNRLVNNTVDIVEKEMCNRLSANDVQVLRQAHTTSRSSRASRASRASRGPRTSRLNRNKTILRQLAPDAPQSPVGHQGHRQPRAQVLQSQPPQPQSQLPPQPHQRSPPHEIELVHPNGILRHYADRRPSHGTSCGTPRSDTAITANTSTLPHAQGGNGNIYTMQTSPSHSNGQPISPWGLAADHSSHGFHQQSNINIHCHADTSTSGSTGTQDQSAFLFDLDQQSWQGLELYDAFGAIPENITMLDYFSAFSMSSQDGSVGLLGGLGGQIGQGGQPGQTGRGADIFQDLGGWPEPLTNSILNFQTDFPDSRYTG